MSEHSIQPAHHPSDARLLDYAAGSLAEPMSLLVASHMALCERCRHEAAKIEDLGGALLCELEPSPLAEGSLDQMFARLERQSEQGVDRLPTEAIEDGEMDLPEPLRSYLGGRLDTLPWRRLGPLAQVRLLSDYPGVTTRLLSIRAGTAMPSHTHDGEELTLVLRGAFHDDFGHYGRGDVAEADSDVDHRPIADDGEDCLCLAVTDAPLKLTGKLGRLANPFVRL